MAYADIGDFAPDDALTAADMDQIRANFQAGVPDIFTTKGDLAVATAADAASRLAVGANDSTLVAASGEATGLAWQIQPAARVYNDANIDPDTGQWVTLTFNQERFDTDAVHSVAANTSRFTIPANGGGLYLIGVNINAGTSSTWGLRLLLNGGTVIAAVEHTAIEFNLVTLYELAATNYIEAQVYAHSNYDVESSANFSPEFWAIWQRRQ